MQKTIRLLDGNHTDCGGFLLDLAYPHRPTLRFILRAGAGSDGTAGRIAASRGTATWHVGSRPPRASVEPWLGHHGPVVTRRNPNHV